MLRTAAPILVILTLAQIGLAAEKHKPSPKYETGKIVDVQKKVNTKVLYYIVNTPITKDEPYFEISVQFRDDIYLGRYMPRHADEELPEEWMSGGEVQGRVDGHHLYLKRPAGVDMDLVIVKHTAVPK